MNATKEALNKSVRGEPFGFAQDRLVEPRIHQIRDVSETYRSPFDRPVLSEAEGFWANGGLAQGFSKLIVLLFVVLPVGQVGANQTFNNFNQAFLQTYSEYENAYENLNAKIEKCSLRQEKDYDFKSIVQKIPEGLTAEQLNAALFVLKRRHDEQCISDEVGVYVIKAAGLSKFLEMTKLHKFSVESMGDVELVKNKITDTNEMLFGLPESYVEMLMHYYSISKADREKLESIKELQSNYNIIRLLDVMKNN